MSTKVFQVLSSHSHVADGLASAKCRNLSLRSYKRIARCVISFPKAQKPCTRARGGVCLQRSTDVHQRVLLSFYLLATAIMQLWRMTRATFRFELDQPTPHLRLSNLRVSASDSSRTQACLPCLKTPPGRHSDFFGGRNDIHRLGDTL